MLRPAHPTGSQEPTWREGTTAGVGGCTGGDGGPWGSWSRGREVQSSGAYLWPPFPDQPSLALRLGSLGSP